jgi:ketosteroid isomerase-like protein
LQLWREPDTYRGHGGIRRYFETFQEAMDDINFEGVRFWDAGEQVVVSVRPKQTAIPVEQRAALVWTVRDGRATAVRAFASLSQALASVGLEEQPAGAGGGSAE